MSYLGKKGYTIYKNTITEKTINETKTNLTVKPKTTQKFETKEYPIYRESNTKLYLPRYYGLKHFGEYNNTLSKGLNINVDFIGNLFDYQNTIIDKYINHVGDSGGGLLDVEPGKGKTVMALNIISKLKTKTFI
jgi:superfamily II DNA or RNA helicase